MHRRVGDLAEALLGGIVWLARAEADMALKRFAVVGQGRVLLAGGRGIELAVMREAGRLHGLVVRDDVLPECGQDAGQCHATQAAIAFWQSHIRDGFRLRLVDACFTGQPVDQFGLVLLAQNVADDFVLSGFVVTEPGLAEMRGLAQDGAGDVAFEFLSLWVFKVELHGAFEAKQRLDLRESAFGIVFERINQCVALSQRQGLLLQTLA